MTAVTGFTKRKEDGKYDIKTCASEPSVCEVQTGYYRLINEKPKDQIHAFPSTADNVNVFLPSRVVEDKSNFKRLVLDSMREKASCYKMDPCNIYTQDFCCKNIKMPEDEEVTGTTPQEDEADAKEKNVGEMVFAIIMIIVVSLMMIGVIGLVAYLANSS